MFKRKIYEKLLTWKKESASEKALLIEGARRIGKSTIAEEFAKNEYRSYILIDFNDVSDVVTDAFNRYLNDLDTFFLILSTEYNKTLYPKESLIKMPLIEPLEYKEVKRIKEFVLAIDTSGSTSGELVQRFVQKTYNVLKSTETFFSKINLHIIQCDADIQEHVKITSQEEFDEYLKTMKIHGLGGTDFRPVFKLTDKLIKEKEFTNLKGLIYFTDGFGEFPTQKPNYETAFVFIDDEYNNYDVPPWAIKLILKSEEI